MSNSSKFFWLVLGLVVAGVVLLAWFGYWIFAVPLAGAALAYLINPRLEARVEGESSQEAPRRAWRMLRTEMLLLGGCLLIVLFLAYR